LNKSQRQQNEMGMAENGWGLKAGVKI